MEGINVGPTLEQDLPAITALIVDLSNEIDDPDATDDNGIEKNVRVHFQDSDSHFLVARRADAVVGFVNFATRKTIIHSS